MILDINKTFPELSSITLSVTQDCNLRCKYCCESHNPGVMSLDVALKAIDILCLSDKYVRYENTKDIIFFGGEPTLCFHSIIKPVVEYCETKYKQFTFNYAITTNATLLTDEIIDFFDIHKFVVLLSLDGNKESHDANRVYKNSDTGSFDKAITNIKKALVKFKAPVRGTITPSTCHNFFNNIKFLNDLGVSGVSIVPDVLSNWSDKDIKKLELEIKKYTLQLVSDVQLHKEPLKLAIMYNMIEHILQHSECTTRDDGKFFCGLGVDNPTVLWDGTIVSCDFASNCDKDKIYTIGDIYTGIDIKKRDSLCKMYNSSVPVSSEPEMCDACKCKAFCVHKTCHYFGTIISGDMNKKQSIMCKFEQAFYDASIYVLNTLGVEKVQEVFNMNRDN